MALYILISHNIFIMINHLICLLLGCLLSTTITAQEHVYVDDKIDDENIITLRVDDEMPFPDIKVLLARDIPFEDFTVGITPYRAQANYVITRTLQDARRVVKIDNCDNFPDFQIMVNDDEAFPDVRIEFRDNSAFVDFLIYSEKTTVSEQELIACLLPLIREKAGK